MHYTAATHTRFESAMRKLRRQSYTHARQGKETGSLGLEFPKEEYAYANITYG